MKITEHVYNMHIDDGAPSHPGGSNNYFVGDPADEMVLLDTGDHWREWTRAILDYYDGLGRPKISAILITHGHVDHVGGLDRVQEATGAVVRCHPKLADRLRKVLDDDDAVVALEHGEKVAAAGAALEALFTPGHEVDHICYHLAADRAMFTGDTVLGASSTSVGDLAAYMKSLELLMEFDHDTVLPAHGPVVPPPKGGSLVKWQYDHRARRERQVIDALQAGHATADAITDAIYPKDLKDALRRTARRNVSTHLEKLRREGTATETPSEFRLA